MIAAAEPEPELQEASTQGCRNPLASVVQRALSEPRGRGRLGLAWARAMALLSAVCAAPRRRTPDRAENSAPRFAPRRPAHPVRVLKATAELDDAAASSCRGTDKASLEGKSSGPTDAAGRTSELLFPYGATFGCGRYTGPSGSGHRPRGPAPWRVLWSLPHPPTSIVDRFDNEHGWVQVVSYRPGDAGCVTDTICCLVFRNSKGGTGGVDAGEVPVACRSGTH